MTYERYDPEPPEGWANFYAGNYAGNPPWEPLANFNTCTNCLNLRHLACRSESCECARDDHGGDERAVIL